MGRVSLRIKEFPDDGRIWRVDWFGGIERNVQIPTEPKIQLIILCTGQKCYTPNDIAL